MVWSCQQKTPFQRMPWRGAGGDRIPASGGVAVLQIDILKDQASKQPPMLFHTRHIYAIIALSLAGSVLSGCSSINEKLSAGMGDYIPQWAGGLPADAPPRPGTAKYDEYMREREKNRLLPADQRNGAKPDQTKTDPVH
jgi:hypothetical protein